MNDRADIEMKTISVKNKNNDYQRFEALKNNRNKRYKYNQFIVEGVRSLNEAVKNNWSRDVLEHQIESGLYGKSHYDAYTIVVSF